MPAWVNLDLFRPRQRPVDDVFRIVFVRQITQRKGISYLVEAFKRASIPKSELVLLGRPIGSVDPWAQIPGVKHVPLMPRSQLPAVYANADVYVLPSLVEGFGLTGLEAMASGLPVVLSEHTFGSDVITDGVDGYVVPIRDPESIAERLRLSRPTRTVGTKWASPPAPEPNSTRGKRRDVVSPMRSRSCWARRLDRERDTPFPR